MHNHSSTYLLHSHVQKLQITSKITFIYSNNVFEKYKREHKQVTQQLKYI